MTLAKSDRWHTPVLVHEVLAMLNPRDGSLYIDGTFGGGGYSRALLEAADCRVWGLDRDPEVVRHGEQMAKEFPRRLAVSEGRFSEIDSLAHARNIDAVDGITLDLGLSSHQLEDPRRGFSFSRDGPLDMRLSGRGPTAADVVNHATEAELAEILHKYGEERQARRVARAIVRARERKPITRTLQLAELVRNVVRQSRDGIDPATRTFQALRIYLNGELTELDRGLSAAERVLAPGGRLAVVSYHSLEDRRVKAFLRSRSGGRPKGTRHLPPDPSAGRRPTFRPLHRRAVKPSRTEIAANPRCRSARLRGSERTQHPAWDGGQRS